MKILITGASGFVGLHLVRQLLNTEHCVVVFFRGKASGRKELEELSMRKPNLKIVYGDIRNNYDIKKAMEGIDVVFHLAMSISSIDDELNHQINVKGTRNLVEACKIQGVKRVVYTSTSIVGLKDKCNYGLTKLQAEEILRESNLDLTIFRFSMVYGLGGPGFARIVKNIKSFPGFIPLIGKGNCRRQPVFVDDVVNALTVCLDNDISIGKVYFLGGPDAITFRQMVTMTSAALGIKKKIVPMPLALCKSVALVAGKLGHPIIKTRDIVSITQDNIGDTNLAREDLGFQPRSFEEGIRLSFKGLSKDFSITSK
jgi:nucleoside-diphosphate-sugar epimerase